MTAVRFHFIPSANTGLTGSGLGQEPGSRPALLTALSREEALGERNIAALSSHSAWENRLNSPLSGDDRHQSARHDARLQRALRKCLVLEAQERVRSLRASSTESLITPSVFLASPRTPGSYEATRICLLSLLSSLDL